MPNFKPKAKKKIKVNKQSIQTLDNKHTDKMKEFHKIENETLVINVQEKELRKKLKTTTNIEDKLNYKDKIIELKKKIKILENKKKEYLLENSNLIFPYFEKKKQLSQGKIETKNKILHNFFKKDKKIELKNDISESHKFLTNMDENMLNIKNYEINSYEVCKCGGEFIHIDYKGLVVCNKCAIQKTYLIEHEKPSYKEPPKEVCFYAYKIIKQFLEI